MTIVRIRTKETLLQPEIAQLILRGARKIGFSTPAAVVAELALNPADDRLGIFVGMVADKPSGVAIAQLPMSVFMLMPTIVMAYNESAPRMLVEMVAERLMEWLTGAGHQQALALNLRHTDRAYMRGLAHFGVPRRIGGVIAFQLRHDVAG